MVIVDSLNYIKGYPVMINHGAETEFAAEVAREISGDCAEAPLIMGGEDFAFYGERIPACFFLLGQQAEDADPMPPLHSPKYDFNDGTIETGIRLMTRLALEG